VAAAGTRVGAWGAGIPPAVEWGLLCSIDSRRYFTALGEGWEDALGWNREELFSRPFTDFVHPADRDTTLASLAAAWQGDSAAIALDTRFRMRGGRWQRVRWSPSPDRTEVAGERPAPPPARRRWRDDPVIGAALRGLVAVSLICASIGVGFALTSFAPQDKGNPPLAAANQVPAGMGGPITVSGPTSHVWNGATPPPGLMGAPLER
jgi:PAS domain S-box-containing protein